MEKYYTVKEVAKILSYSEDRIRDMIRSGRINAFRPNGGQGHFRILASEIERLSIIGFEQNMEALEKMFNDRKNNKDTYAANVPKTKNYGVPNRLSSSAR